MSELCLLNSDALYCCSLKFCRQPCSLASNSLSKWDSWKEFTLFPPHSQVLTAPSNKSPSAFTGQDRCAIGCQICRDGERLCKRTAGSEESHKSIKMPQSAPCYFGTVNWGHGGAAAVTAHLMFVRVYFGLKIMYHEYTRLKNPPPTHYTEICKWKAKLQIKAFYRILKPEEFIFDFSHTSLSLLHFHLFSLVSFPSLR